MAAAPVFLRRSNPPNTTENHRCTSTVRGLVLSEIFLPLENSRSLTRRSRSACRSCIISTPPTDGENSACSLSLRNKHEASVCRADSLLVKLQTLFHIKKSTAPNIVAEKPPQIPKIQAPLIYFGSSAAQLRGRSQSTAVCRSHLRSKKHTPEGVSLQVSPRKNCDFEPLICTTPWPVCASGVKTTQLTSFCPSSGHPGLPTSTTRAMQQKHLSAQLPVEVLPQIASQPSSGLWSVGSLGSLGVVGGLGPLRVQRPPTPTDVSDFKSTRPPSLPCQKESSSFSSGDSAVELFFPASVDKPPSSGTTCPQLRIRHPSVKPSKLYSPTYTAPSSGIYEELGNDLAIAPPTDLFQKTSFSPMPSPCYSEVREDVPSISTGARTSCKLVQKEEEVADHHQYALPRASTANRSQGLDFGPTVPPKGPFRLPESERFFPPLALSASSHSPSATKSSSSQPTPQLQAASALRVCHKGSSIRKDLANRRPSSSAISYGSGDNWYAEILPYKPSTLPESLVDRLKHRNSSFIQASSGSSSLLGNNNNSSDNYLMTQSLFDPLNARVKEHPEVSVTCRPTSRARPVSCHDASMMAVMNLPCLDHLSAQKCDRQLLQPPQPKPPLVGSSLGSVLEPLQLRPSDSPFLGQYCRLKFVVPPAPFSTDPTFDAGR